MARLSDTLLVILSTASRRNDRGVDLPTSVTVARRGACIEAHLKAVWVKLVIKLLLHDVNEIENRSPFCVSRREPIDNQSPCNDEGVSR